METSTKGLQYVVDGEGNSLAVIIPIEKWKEILELYPDLKEEYGTPKLKIDLIKNPES